MYWGVRGVLGAGRKCRYSGQEGYRWHKGVLGAPRGVAGVGGCYGSIRGAWGLAGSIGTQGPEGYRWHKGHWGLLGM